MKYHTQNWSLVITTGPCVNALNWILQFDWSVSWLLLKTLHCGLIDLTFYCLLNLSMQSMTWFLPDISRPTEGSSKTHLPSHVKTYIARVTRWRTYADSYAGSCLSKRQNLFDIAACYVSYVLWSWDTACRNTTANRCSLTTIIIWYAVQYVNSKMMSE